MQKGLRSWFEYYNRERTHQSLSRMTPDECYFKEQVKQAAWRLGAIRVSSSHPMAHWVAQVEKYIKKRKSHDPKFAKNYDSGYEQFKIGALLKQAREEAGLTQEELAAKLNTKKSAISRIENHAEDIKLSTLEKFANALGKELRLEVA